MKGSSTSTQSAIIVPRPVNRNSITFENLLSMTQKGLKLNGIATIDQLSYAYQNGGVSNKLAKVTDAVSDAATKLGDFKDGTNGTADDYAYDGNGSLTSDQNKAISAVTYNHLNLPNQVTVTSKGSIAYTYDAGAAS